MQYFFLVILLPFRKQKRTEKNLGKKHFQDEKLNKQRNSFFFHPTTRAEISVSFFIRIITKALIKSSLPGIFVCVRLDPC